MIKNEYCLFGIDFNENKEQKELIHEIYLDPRRKPVVFCEGAAGTGKTFTALAASLALVRNRGAKKRYKTIYYIREPVEIGHRLGYLKGKQEDKYAPYLGGLLDNYRHLMAYTTDKDEIALAAKNIRKKTDDTSDLPPEYAHLPSDIVPLAPEFLRGRSFEDAILIVDEAQNMTLDELQTAVTRLGNNCKMIILGSLLQVDVNVEGENPFSLAYKILEPTGFVSKVTLTKSERSGFVAMFDEAFAFYKNQCKKPAK